MSTKQVTVFAPASSANLGPGFDLLGVAVGGIGDYVSATFSEERPGMWIESIEGDGGQLPRDIETNTVGIAAQATLRILRDKAPACLEGTPKGIALSLMKGLPLGSGLGSSGASAAAAVWAISELFGSPLPKEELLLAGLEAEAGVSGWHADNVAASLLGGFVLVRSYEPLDVLKIPAPASLTLVLVKPHVSVATKAARTVVPTEIPMKQHVANSGNLAAMMVALARGDVALFGRAVQDEIVEPVRAPLIPGFAMVKRAALDAGALGCSISGSGPTIFAVVEGAKASGVVKDAMQSAFRTEVSLESTAYVCSIDADGARQVNARPTSL